MPVRTFTASVKGEDRYVYTPINDGSTLLVVADGHGGAKCADSTVTAIQAAFQTAQTEAKLRDAGNDWPVTAENLLREAMAVAAKQTEGESSGAVVTAVLASSAGDMVAWAQVGDTVAIWRNKEGDIERTPDHNCRSNIAERKAAVQRGGHYIAGYIMAPDGSGGLQPARSLGDEYMGRVASKEPDVGSSTLDGPLLVSSDGVITGIQGSPKAETAAFTQLLEQAEAGEDLEPSVNALLPGGFLDDVTVLVFVPEAGDGE
ncbi:MAG: protein phosphatase 2C domain-containing protein [Spirochaetia bacterium]